MTPKKYSVVIADTSCFILLDKIGQLSLLQKVFGNVVTTHTIAGEFAKPLPDWINTESPVNHHYTQLLEMEIDKGEASAIALALEKNTTLLVLDDSKARKLASRLSLDYTGTLGILLKGKELGIFPFIKPLLLQIQQTNFRFSERVLMDILDQANET